MTATPASPETVPAQTVRRRLQELRERGGDPAPFADLAWRYLAEVPRDPEMALLAVRAFVELGLGGPARELLNSRGDLAAAGVDVAQLRRSVACVPTGRVPWPELSGWLEAGIDALKRRHPHVAVHEAALRSATSDLQMLRGTDGRLHLLRGRSGAAQSTWVSGLTVAARLGDVDLETPARPDAILLVGFALDGLIETVHARAAQAADGKQVALFLAEEGFDELAAWLHAADRTIILDDPRVHVVAGPHAAADLERLLDADDNLPIPVVRLAGHRPGSAVRPFDEACRRAHADREKRYRQIVAQLEARAAGRDRAHWAARLRAGTSGGNAPRVLGLTSRFTTMLQFSMRDIGAACEALGCTFRLGIEPATHARSSVLTVAKTVLDFDPDLIVLINHFRRELPEAMPGVPLLTWVQDPTEDVLSAPTGASIGALDFVCGYYLGVCTGEFGYPAQRFFPVSVPVSARLFRPGPLDERQRERLACDLLYVGHMHETPPELLESFRRNTAPALHPVLERIAAAVASLHQRGALISHPRAMRAVVDEAAADSGLRLPPERVEHLAAFFAYRLYDLLYRRQTLSWAADWARRTGRTLRIHGRGWPRDPELGPNACGPIEHGDPLCRAYRGARIALQTIPGGYSHQRAYEANASGCLVVGRYVPTDFGGLTLEQYRARRDEPAVRSGSSLAFPTLDEVVFRDADEMAALLERFLADEDLYESTLRRFQAIVSDRFTYDVVVRDVLERIRRELDRP